MACAGWLKPGPPGACCPTICRPGRRSTNKPNAGCALASLNSWSMTCTLLREANGRDADPSAVIFDSRTLQSTPESGGRAGYDGGKRRKGSKVHMAVDTVGHLLTVQVT